MGCARVVMKDAASPLSGGARMRYGLHAGAAATVGFVRAVIRLPIMPVPLHRIRAAIRPTSVPARLHSTLG